MNVRTVLNLFIVAILIPLLSGCLSKEGRAIMKNDDIKEQIEEQVSAYGIDFYDLELEADTDDMEFGPDQKFPLVKNMDELRVPVKVIGVPAFVVSADFSIKADKDGKREPSLMEIEGIEELGDFLLTHLYLLHHEKDLKALDEMDGVHLEEVLVKSESAQEGSLIYSLIEDYNDGKFRNAVHYDKLMAKHQSQLPNYLPKITVNVFSSKEDTMREKFENFVAHLESGHTSIPRAEYHIYSSSSEEDSEKLTKEIRVDGKGL
ncbi:hypothetical protein LG307_13245 [Sutcliffiella horikoshii]|uniref:hypothetical protein n=1 Tax=Sutcliffiella horikoshii TaxID=79883 RepID=UPI00384D4CCA